MNLKLHVQIHFISSPLTLMTPAFHPCEKFFFLSRIHPVLFNPNFHLDSNQNVLALFTVQLNHVTANLLAANFRCRPMYPSTKSFDNSDADIFKNPDSYEIPTRYTQNQSNQAHPYIYTYINTSRAQRLSL